MTPTNPNKIHSPGTQVVVLRPIHDSSGKQIHPRLAVGTIVKSPLDLNHSYRVRFLDGFEDSIRPKDIALLSHYKSGEVGKFASGEMPPELFERVIYRVVVGSRAFGLDGEGSDTDRRGIFLPTAHQHWSIYGVPTQIECQTTEQCYWEFQRFIVLALKANPNILECLFSPLVETCTEFGKRLLGHRRIFVTKLIYQTYGGYVMSQFKKMQAELRNRGEIKWKHVMHLIRLLNSGIHALETGDILVDVGPLKERLLSIRNGEMTWEQYDRWRKDLHSRFETAYSQSSLPDRPDYEMANQLVIEAREAALQKELP